ncbi:MAG: L-histidine N(alpha)-methyltransferase [Leptospiraceae bacterium]|nr:L-histidine N(alpha)-methyltransferase [Leptospiraceae bacterium]
MKSQILTAIEQFQIDTDLGLSSSPRYLRPKYFYDEEGSKIFQEIMNMPEYYLTDAEIEIFELNSNKIIEHISQTYDEILLLELGSGDGIKTEIFIRSCIESHLQLKYIPIDISSDILEELKAKFKINHPGIEIDARVGDYFQVLEVLKQDSEYKNVPKLVLFLGSNLGNFSNQETNQFIEHLKNILNPNDFFLLGFDLKKSPSVILPAYDDPKGITQRFNLNHLLRINRELNGTFDINKFDHHVSYDPLSGEVKSYLLANTNSTVVVGSIDKVFNFNKWDSIYMECSRKYSIPDMENLARDHGFQVVENYLDRNQYFCNSLWIRK